MNIDKSPAPPKELHVAEGSTFALLGEHLKQSGNDEISLDYEQVETILGKPLCKSAYKYYSYLSPGKNRPVGNVIYNSGYDLDRVDIKGQQIYLKKAEVSAAC